MPNTTNSNSNPNSRRRVTFNPSVRCIEIISARDYTPQELYATWFNAEDMDRITNQCFKLLKRMDAGRADKYCTRGLESHTGIGRITKTKNRATAKEAVIIEQTKQYWSDQRVDEQAIADAYQRASASCQMWAQVMGKRDQEAADEIYFENEEDNSHDLTIRSGASTKQPSPTSSPKDTVIPRRLPKHYRSGMARAA